MEVYRILQMRLIKGKENYLVQWAGKHRTESTWHSKSEIIKKYPKQLIHFDNYEANLTKNKGLKLSCYKQVKVEDMVKQNNKNEDNRHRTNGSMKLRDEQTKLPLKQQVNLSMPSDQFKIVIRTDHKFESHWAYNDKVEQIFSKQAHSESYQIMWSDGNKGEVVQSDLIQRESIKLCQFWENKLGISARKKRKLI